jgi:hypothetical protein
LTSNSSNSKSKNHCLINVNLFGNSPINETTTSKFGLKEEKKNMKGRILVYHEKDADSNKFKYVGSGDLTFISMRVRDGKYIVVFEFSERTIENME